MTASQDVFRTFTENSLRLFRSTGRVIIINIVIVSIYQHLFDVCVRMLTAIVHSYRIHLSPGSRRSSGSVTRAAMTRAGSSSEPSARSTSSRPHKRARTAESTPPLPPVIIPHAVLQQSPANFVHENLSPCLVPDAPDTPPPLVEARLPLAAVTRFHASESLSSGSSHSSPVASYHSSPPHLISPIPATEGRIHSPELVYPQSGGHFAPPATQNGSPHSQWTYRPHSEPYQSDPESVPHGNTQRYPSEHLRTPPPALNAPSQNLQVNREFQDETYTYPANYDATPLDSATSMSHGRGSENTYADHHHHENNVSSQHQALLHRGTPSASTSRHSIAHISHPYEHPPPTSPHLVSPLESQSPTPVFSVASPVSRSHYHETRESDNSVASLTRHPSSNSASSQYDSNSLSSAGYSQSMSNIHDTSQSHVSPSHGAYSTLSSQYSNPHDSLAHLILPARYDSPPPILAPIQDERVIRGEHEITPRQDSEAISSYPHHYAPHAPLPPISSYSPNVEFASTQLRPIANYYTYLHQPQPQHAAGHPHYLSHYSSLSSAHHHHEASWRVGDVR